MKIEIEKVEHGYFVEINAKKFVYTDFMKVCNELCNEILQMEHKYFDGNIHGKIELKYIKKL